MASIVRASEEAEAHGPPELRYEQRMGYTTDGRTTSFPCRDGVRSDIRRTRHIQGTPDHLARFERETRGT